jgi:hypothetical protein
MAAMNVKKGLLNSYSFSRHCLYDVGNLGTVCSKGSFLHDLDDLTCEGVNV